jgi:hypothetical protein
VKIRMKVPISGTGGPNADGTWPPVGSEFRVDDEYGMHLCKAGLAEPVVEDFTETATPPEAEKRGPGRPRKQ